MDKAKMDVRVGGKWLICMAMAERKMQMWHTAEYRTRPVYTDSVADEQGNLIAPRWG